MSNILFDRLIASADQDGIVIDAPTKGRWIKRLNEPDAEMMVKAEVEPLILGRRSRALMVLFEDTRYYLMTGFEIVGTDVDGLNICALTPALFALAVIELNLLPIGSASQIRDALEGRHKDKDGYAGHDLEEIAALYPFILCFQANADFPFTENPIRAVGSYVAHTYDNGALSISKNTRESLARVFEAGNRYVPYNLILQGMLSFSWQSFFLEVYRCIENMYPLSRIQRLTTGWKPDASIRDIAILLEKELSWRPKEEEALVSILRQCSITAVGALLDAMGGDASSSNDLYASSANLVYSTRNELVHFRPREPSCSKDDIEWDAQIRALIECLDEIYHAAGDTFHELQIISADAVKGVDLAFT